MESVIAIDDVCDLLEDQVKSAGRQTVTEPFPAPNLSTTQKCERNLSWLNSFADVF